MTPKSKGLKSKVYIQDRMNVFGRITREYSAISEWVEALPCERIIVYEHQADEEINRTHIHFYITKCEIKPDAMKSRFRTKYGAIDKGDWAFALQQKNGEALNEGAITYMSKGSLQPVYNKGWTAEEIQPLKMLWQPPAKTMLKAVDGKLVRVVDESSKKTRKQLLELMCADLPHEIDRGPDGIKTVMKQVRKILVKNNEVIGQYKVFDYCDSVYMYKYKEVWLEAMCDKYNKKIFG